MRGNIRMIARPRHTPGRMNGIEQRYASYLDVRKQAGEVACWRYESLTLRLAKATRYTPDFWVVMADGRVEIHEVKGFWEDDARVKVKVAAEMFHEFRFVAVTWSRKKGWETEHFGEGE